MGITAWVELALLGGHKEHKTLDLIRRVRRERESLLSGNEAFFLHSLASAQSALDGDMAEVGVYEGCSAKIISTAAPEKRLHLFDTFAGLPEPGDGERQLLRGGQYASSLDAVRTYLDMAPQVTFHQGSFPASATECEHHRFSFVHLDVDLRDSTRACLEFFYPRMSAGGVILTHDYSYLEGVKTAFDQFFASRPEKVIELPTSQAMVIKA